MKKNRIKLFCRFYYKIFLLVILVFFIGREEYLFAQKVHSGKLQEVRERLPLNEGWRFMRYEGDADTLIYDERPLIEKHNDNIVADTRATQEGYQRSSDRSLKPWILPMANGFIKDSTKHHKRPAGNPGANFSLVKNDFNDNDWELVTLPHDWAINKPFYKGNDPVVGGGMGRLPSHGVAWYRNKFMIPLAEKEKRIYLEIGGAMSYAMVWLNGHLVGGWPHGYSSFQVDLTPYLKYGENNQLAIRLDNPNYSSRWYTGGGLYRKVWLVKTNALQVAQWGTFVTTENVSEKSALVKAKVSLKSSLNKDKKVKLITEIYELNENEELGKKVGVVPGQQYTIPAGVVKEVSLSAVIDNPKLWGPLPLQKPHRYKMITTLYADDELQDRYETSFGIRSLVFDGTKGLLVNGIPVRIQGVNQHHDLGALGAAFNVRAAERQLKLLQEMGCNAIRMAHNPPAQELLNLTDKMGLLVVNELYDSWEKGKTPLDFHLIFPDWYEADTRSFVRRDRNHPSVIAWSFGNEVGEQYTDEKGAEWARTLYTIIKEEDSTRPATASMNFAKPDMPFSAQMDIISLNYQGEGIRDAPAYAHLTGIRTAPLYPAFHAQYPDKLIVSSETASALSTRGTYLFPVENGNSAPVSEGKGGNGAAQQVSAYELYTAAFGASADKVFASQDQHPYVAGEFVWTGWDYLGEPTPYYTARSSYSGIIDLAGFKKDRFYLYQSRWKPDKPMVHILPHWNWADRVGKQTPVHIFTSGDEVELFLNGKSLGRKKKKLYEYRLRWDDVIYEPGAIKAVAYKNGKKWAEETIRTTGKVTGINLTADRKEILADGEDLSFITLELTDAQGTLVPMSDNNIIVRIEGAGEIIGMDNGDPADLTSFAQKERKAFAGKLLIIVKAHKGKQGAIKIITATEGIPEENIIIQSK